MRNGYPVALLLLASAAPSWAAENTLCQPAETLVWSCHAAKKTYSLCASSDLAKTQGYLQYRAGSAAGREFTYPATLAHPLGRFQFTLGAHGGHLEFKNANVKYTIAADLNGLPAIYIDQDERHIGTVRCKDEAGDLLGNATLDLFHETGISE